MQGKASPRWLVLLHHSGQGSRVGLGRSPQHLRPGGICGTTRRMNEAHTWQRSNEIPRGFIASTRGRVTVLSGTPKGKNFRARGQARSTTLIAYTITCVSNRHWSVSVWYDSS